MERNKAIETLAEIAKRNYPDGNGKLIRRPKGKNEFWFVCNICGDILRINTVGYPMPMQRYMEEKAHIDMHIYHMMYWQA